MFDDDDDGNNNDDINDDVMTMVRAVVDDVRRTYAHCNTSDSSEF